MCTFCKSRNFSIRRRSISIGAQWIFLFAFPLLGLIFAERPADAQQSPTEYQVEAAYLFNFLKFVEWPDDLPAEFRTHWVIGTLGKNYFADELEQIVSGKTVQGRPIQIRRFQSNDDARTCHILFIGTSEKRSLPHLLAALRGSSVLLVADMDHFVDSGGMIQFVAEDSHVRLAINVRATGRARLKISSKLLSIALSVTSGYPGEIN